MEAVISPRAARLGKAGHARNHAAMGRATRLGQRWPALFPVDQQRHRLACTLSRSGRDLAHVGHQCRGRHGILSIRNRQGRWRCRGDVVRGSRWPRVLARSLFAHYRLQRIHQRVVTSADRCLAPAGRRKLATSVGTRRLADPRHRRRVSRRDLPPRWRDRCRHARRGLVAARLHMVEAGWLPGRRPKRRQTAAFIKMTAVLHGVVL